MQNRKICSIDEYIRKSKEENIDNLEGKLLRKYKDRYLVYSALYRNIDAVTLPGAKTKIVGTYKRAVTKRVIKYLERKDLEEIRRLKKKAGEELFVKAIRFLEPVEQAVLLELLEIEGLVTRDKIKKYCERKLERLEDSKYKNYVIYIYIALCLGSKKVDMFVKNVLADYGKVKYLGKIYKAYDRYGFTNVPVTDDITRIRIWKHACMSDIEPIKKLFLDYKTLVFAKPTKEHLKEHAHVTLDAENVMKSVFLEDPVEVIEREYKKRQHTEMFYDNTRHKIILYIKCSKVIGYNIASREIDCLKIVLDNLARVITAYPTIHEFKNNF